MGRSLAVALTAITAVSAVLLWAILTFPPVPGPPPDAQEVRPGMPVVRSAGKSRADLSCRRPSLARRAGRVCGLCPDGCQRGARGLHRATDRRLLRPVSSRRRDDAAVRRGAARPLAETFQRENPAWQVRTHLGDAATRDCLDRLLGGVEPPSLLFTAGHGLGFTEGDDRQEPLQGALLCQDWPGPSAGWGQGLQDDWYFAADHVAPGVDLAGLVCFCFACHSAGTPRESAFKLLDDGHLKPLAPRAFVASLPRKLLARGACAVIGHVDQSWETSFVWSGAGAQRTVFESALWQIAAGGRVGEALGVFGERWAEIATDLGEAMTDSEKAWLWLAHNDARGYILLGDPAARIRSG